MVQRMVVNVIEVQMKKMARLLEDVIAKLLLGVKDVTIAKTVIGILRQKIQMDVRVCLRDT